MFQPCVFFLKSRKNHKKCTSHATCRSMYGTDTVFCVLTSHLQTKIFSRASVWENLSFSILNPDSTTNQTLHTISTKWPLKSQVRFFNGLRYRATWKWWIWNIDSGRLDTFGFRKCEFFNSLDIYNPKLLPVRIIQSRISTIL